MSGGSLDYCYSKVGDAADTIWRCARNPLEKAFASHLQSVSVALRSIEWELSGNGDRDCEKNIRAVVTHEQELRMAIADAEKSRASLDALLESARKRLETEATK